jgi:toxin YoeB
LKVVFTRDGWEDFRSWDDDPRVRAALLRLIEDARRSPFQGLGKPEPLKGALSGWWSRRITGEHRLVYRVAGAGEEQRLEIIQARYHY